MIFLRSNTTLRTGIDDGLTSRCDGASGDLDIIHIEGPVSSLSGNGVDNINSVEITGVVVGIDSSDDEFSVGTTGSEVESEFVLLQVVRVDESSEGCLHSVDGDVIPSHTEDTVELTQTVRESESGSVVDLGEGVVTDGGITCCVQREARVSVFVTIEFRSCRSMAFVSVYGVCVGLWRLCRSMAFVSVYGVA